MGANDVRLNYITEVGKALSDMGAVKTATTAQIKETQRATAALAAYDKAQAAVGTTASKVVVPSLGATTAAAGNLQAQLFDIGVGLQGGQNPLTILTQQGPQVLQALTGAGGGADALKMALMRTAAVVGPLALTIGVAVAAWKSYTEDATRATKISLEVRDALDDTRWMLDRTAAATLAYDVATGDLTETQGKLIASNRALFAQYNSSTEETAGKLSKLKAEQAGVVTQLTDFATAAYSVLPTGVIMRKLIDGLTTSSAEYQQEIDALNGAQTVAVERLGAAKVATEKQIEAEAKRKGSVSGVTDALRAQRDEEERLAKMREAMIEEVTRNADAQVEEVHRVAEAKKKSADESAEITQKAYDDAKKQREQAAADAYALSMATGDAIAGVFAVGAEGAAFLSEQVAEQGIGSGKALFGVSKALAIANATTNAWLAYTAALTVPVIGPVLAGTALASGLLAVGQIAATEPQYHRGRASDEMPATILRSERVLTATGARAMGGDRAVAAANRGQAQGGTVTAAFVLGHRVYDKQTKTALSVPGSSLAAALTRGQHVGHR